MTINKNSEDLELDLYLKIINCFQNESVSRKNKEIWKNQSIIKLMNLLERTQNRPLVTNALILLLSLFENVPPDIYNNRGINSSHIPESDKKLLMKELIDEFLPN